MKQYVSELERVYYEEVLPKLDNEIKSMNLGRRANSSLFNANIYNVNALCEAIKNNRHISLLSRESREEIIRNLKERGKI